MSDDEMLMEAIALTDKHDGLTYSARLVLVYDILAALRRVRDAATAAERQRCAAVCRDAYEAQESGCCEAVLRDAAAAIERQEGEG